MPKLTIERGRYEGTTTTWAKYIFHPERTSNTLLRKMIRQVPRNVAGTWFFDWNYNLKGDDRA